MKNKIKSIFSDNENILYQNAVFLKWLVIAILSGIVIGAVGAVFHELLSYVTNLRQDNSFLILLLPIGGVIIVWLYKICGMDKDGGTNSIIRGARGEETVSPKTAPLIIIATLLTHLLGGSAGREGAALQLGGSLISPLRKPLKLSDEDYSVLIMCGMAAGFSALFGTPVASAVFAIEVTVVGIVHYSAIVPCLISSVTAAITASAIGVHPTSFRVERVPVFDSGSAVTALQVLLMGIACALVSVLFCAVIPGISKAYKKYIPNPYLRAAAGGLIVATISYGLYFATGTFDYNGAGTDVIVKAFSGECRPEAFLIKILLTALTLGAGFKGGEIVPTMFTGATFGCFFGSLIGLPPSFGAALGLVSVFCGVTNCPFSAIILSIELYSTKGVPYFALAIGLSYMLSGYTGLYSAQKFYDSKLNRKKFKRFRTYQEIKESLKNQDTKEDNNNGTD
ncbi:chloride channel protein [Huintestinicola sp.]|uniref:chloride channel protein n=1 Tax=Huintestinicola sp. TaxID=2981661 RepID=UPI003D7C827F